jgi:hypothetical protein
MGAESHTAFFSYSREDSDFAKKLAADLKSTGASVWMDQLDIEPGVRWDDAVSQALESSPRVLVILSPASAKSENVSDEVSFALSKQKHVIPVLYRECDVPFRLARLQYVDFRTNYNTALQELTGALALKPTPSAAVASEPGRPVPEVTPPAPRQSVSATSAPATGGMNKALLFGIPILLIVLIVAGYFVFRPSGLDVTILAPSGFSAPGFRIDGATYPIEGQSVHVKLAPGDHKYLFPKTNCSGTFTVASDKTTFLPKANAAGDCALQPVSN